VIHHGLEASEVQIRPGTKELASPCLADVSVRDYELDSIEFEVVRPDVDRVDQPRILPDEGSMSHAFFDEPRELVRIELRPRPANCLDVRMGR
jgi:hypothetical protein